MGQNTEITMIVNTDNITPGNVDSHVKFRDNRTNPEPSDPQNFTSLINEKFDVLWQAVDQGGSEETIQIKKIGSKSEKGNAQLLKDQPHVNGKKSSYIATVKDHYMTGEESYYVKFTINNKEHPEYIVDPKLTMEQT